MQKYRRREIDGIFLLDKPAGLSSNQALQAVKRLYNAAKAGHSGSLDPLATGMLPICLGQATKLAGFLLDGDKTYRARVRLGIATDTGDAEGRPTRHSDPSALTRAALETAAASFRGTIAQVPPMYSALKREGQKLYLLARQGEEVAREAREIQIHDLRITAFGEAEFEFELRCSKGTYVRTLAEDWAAAAGQAAHLVALRRTAVDDFGEGEMMSLDSLQAAVESPAGADALLLPALRAVADWPRVAVDSPRALRLAHGNPVLVECPVAAGRLAIVDAQGRLLGLGLGEPPDRINPWRWLSDPVNSPKTQRETK